MDILVDSSGFLSWTDGAGAPRRVRCALGRGGIGDHKTEGDGVTPVGRFPVRSVMVRNDRIATPQTPLPVSTISQADGWCDDPASADYNKRITLPHPGRHEELWRDDGVYDVVIEVGYNDDPIKAGKGSAIFIHLARANYEPTQGCIALRLEDLLDLLKSCDPEAMLVVNS